LRQRSAAAPSAAQPRVIRSRGDALERSAKHATAPRTPCAAAASWRTHVVGDATRQLLRLLDRMKIRQYLVELVGCENAAAPRADATHSQSYRQAAVAPGSGRTNSSTSRGSSSKLGRGMVPGISESGERGRGLRPIRESPRLVSGKASRDRPSDCAVSLRAAHLRAPMALRGFA